jgi:DNA-binding transcriptional regulator YiaG
MGKSAEPWNRRIRRLRRARDWTQDVAAKALGVPVSTLRNWEQARTTPNQFTQDAIESKLKN